jgi:hypothetical protein
MIQMSQPVFQSAEDVPEYSLQEAQKGDWNGKNKMLCVGRSPACDHFLHSNDQWRWTI